MKFQFLPMLAAASAFAAPIVYEAEDQTGVENSAIVESADHSGGKYVSLSNSPMTFSVSVEETAIYDISTSVRIKQYDWTTSRIVVNGEEVVSMLTTPRNNDSDYVVSGYAKLLAGKNEITVGNDAIGVDYISVGIHPAPVFNLEAAPVTPGATESAYKLKRFLTENFGKATVSGMMIGDNAFNYHYGASLEDSYLIETCVPSDSCGLADSLTTWKGQEDIREFKKRTGYFPALGGFDLLFATGGHSDEGWFSGYTDNSIRMARQVWNLGGIPAFTWHWKVGTDTIFYAQSKGFNNVGCTEGVVATAGNNTCFNYTKAFSGDKCATVNPESDEYKLIVADVDKISDRFLNLQDSGVAVLWRPLHEAAGGWFWWGVGGSDCYKKLYQLVFDRMYEKGVRNAIWIWNIERDPAIGYDATALNADWYPGDGYVDIIGVDIYNNSGDNKSNMGYFNKIIEEMGTKKILALTENGPIPDVDSMFQDNSVWSFWMPWYQTWGGGFLNQTTDDVWQKNLADDRIIKLESMPGWKDYEAGISSPEKRGKSLVEINVVGNSLQLSLPTRSGVSLYSLQGKCVRKWGENLSAGTHAFDLQALPRGVYIVRVQGMAGVQNQKFTIR